LISGTAENMLMGRSVRYRPSVTQNR
jgi:hypothetical protein